MSNLIDRDELYKALEAWDWQELYLPVHFKELVDEIPTIKAVEAEPDNGWISVKDRLPESDKIVLIYVCGHRETAYYDNLKRAFILTKDENLYFGMCVVTHWRYLPEPPKGE